jgi:hypothetical protein
VRRRHIARKAVKTAIIVKAAQRLGRRAENAPGQALTASGECPWSGPGARLDVRSGPDHEPAALEIVGLIIFQDELRARPRQAGPTGVPVRTEAAAMIGSYLAAEQDLGRMRPMPTWTRSRPR